MGFKSLLLRALLASIACPPTSVVRGNSLLVNRLEGAVSKNPSESFRTVKQIMSFDYDVDNGWPPHDMKWPRGDLTWPFLGPAINKTSVVTRIPAISGYPQTSSQPPVTVMAQTVQHHSFTEHPAPISRSTTPVFSTHPTERYWALSDDKEKFTQLPATTSRPKERYTSTPSSWLFLNHGKEEEREKFSSESLSDERRTSYPLPYYNQKKNEESQSFNDLFYERDAHLYNQPFFREDVDKLLEGRYMGENNFQNYYPDTKPNHAYGSSKDPYYASMNSYDSLNHGSSNDASPPTILLYPCCPEKKKSILPSISIVLIWSLYLLFFYHVYTNTSSSGRRVKRSFWNLRAKRNFRDVMLDGPTWLSMVHELWEQDDSPENIACIQETLCRMNRLALSAPGQAGWAVSLSSLPLSYLLHARHTGGFTSYIDAALMGRSGANCTELYSSCPRLRY